MWIKILSVFGLGMLGLWEGIPGGFAMRLHPLVVAVVSASGALFATLLMLLLGDRVRSRLIRTRSPTDGPKRERMIDRVWRRYGLIGLGLLAPGLTGAPIGVALGLFLGAPARRLVPWTLAGLFLWTVALTLGAMFGAAGIARLWGH